VRDELEKLLSESVASAKTRAASAFDALAGERPIVLFGAGGLGRRVASELERLGRPPVAFADNDPRRAGERIGAAPILATADAVARYGADAVFVVTVWRSPATERMSTRIERLEQLGAKRVTSFATLAWKHPERLLPYYAIDLPHKVLEAKEDVVRAFEMLEDEASRREYVAQIRFRLHLDFAGLGDPADEPEYFAPDVVRLDADTRFVDCGAYDGDTVRSFLGRAGPGFRGRVAAYEPDPKSFARLEAWRDGLDADLAGRIALHRAGVGAARGQVTFMSDGGTGSAVAAAGAAIDIVSLDDTARAMRPTLVKVDTEGYEPEVLRGAAAIVRELTPTMALCVYHCQDHPWRIPLQVAAMNDGYRYTLRTYCFDGFDLVLYASPRGSR